MSFDEAVHAVVAGLRDVMWRPAFEIDGLSWYYAEDRLYVVRSCRTPIPQYAFVVAAGAQLACEAVEAKRLNPDEMDGGDEERRISFENLELTIVASDQDHARSGWAVRFPPSHVCAGVRIKMEIGEGIDPKALMYRQSVVCSGELVMTIRESDTSFRPRRVLV